MRTRLGPTFSQRLRLPRKTGRVQIDFPAHAPNQPSSASVHDAPRPELNLLRGEARPIVAGPANKKKGLVGETWFPPRLLHLLRQPSNSPSRDGSRPDRREK